ncbi:hypothetical protein [Pontibacter indicus]|uniref:Acetolactate synthase-1/3 small subunit n=1 Tax=Pontibacter indicus TaxID=1317125 RepID=A0A1R3WFD5_9BACT|nr:hypothetical protein [Pontibacter indicus]SIT75909.1 acetolactate synthase-1/3 small subunit [Pontibacter indicus]
MQTLKIYTENKIGVLEKVTTVFTRNRVNITTLNLRANALKDLSLICVSADISPELALKVIPQLKRIIEVADAKLKAESKL